MTTCFHVRVKICDSKFLMHSPSNAAHKTRSFEEDGVRFFPAKMQLKVYKLIPEMMQEGKRRRGKKILCAKISVWVFWYLSPLFLHKVRLHISVCCVYVQNAPSLTKTWQYANYVGKYNINGWPWLHGAVRKWRHHWLIHISLPPIKVIILPFTNNLTKLTKSAHDDDVIYEQPLNSAYFTAELYCVRVILTKEGGKSTLAARA